MGQVFKKGVGIEKGSESLEESAQAALFFVENSLNFLIYELGAGRVGS